MYAQTDCKKANINRKRCLRKEYPQKSNFNNLLKFASKKEQSNCLFTLNGTEHQGCKMSQYDVALHIIKKKTVNSITLISRQFT